MEAPKTPAQWFAMIAGIVLLAMGVLSLVTNGLDFGGTPESASEFIIWQATGWNTLLWIAFGAAGLLLMSRVDAARTYSLIAGVVFAVLAVWGFIDGSDVAGIFAVDTTTNITHAVVGGLGLLVAFMPESMQRKAGVGTEAREDRRFERDRERERLRAPEETETRRPGSRV